LVNVLFWLVLHMVYTSVLLIGFIQALKFEFILVVYKWTFSSLLDRDQL